MDREFEIYNPENLPIDQLPVIYGFNNAGIPGFYHGELLASDGKLMGGHICSSEEHMYGDLGVLKGSRKDRHEGFRKHFPRGYRMDFVRFEDVPTHQGLNDAYEKHKQLTAAREPATAS